MVREFQRSIASQGGLALGGMIRFGRNAALGQIAAEDTPLVPGEPIWFDVAVLADGYWADLRGRLCWANPRSIYNGTMLARWPVRSAR